MVSVPLLVGVDGVPAVVVSVPVPVGGVVSLQKVATVAFPYRKEKNAAWICKHLKCRMFNLAHLHYQKNFSSIRREQHDSNLNDRSIYITRAIFIYFLVNQWLHLIMISFCSLAFQSPYCKWSKSGAWGGFGMRLGNEASYGL